MHAHIYTHTYIYMGIYISLYKYRYISLAFFSWTFLFAKDMICMSILGLTSIPTN